jgi:hypothetical protein
VPGVRDAGYRANEAVPGVRDRRAGIAERQVDQTAADYGADLSDPRFSGPGQSPRQRLR